MLDSAPICIWKGKTVCHTWPRAIPRLVWGWGEFDQEGDSCSWQERGRKVLAHSGCLSFLKLILTSDFCLLCASKSNFESLLWFICPQLGKLWLAGTGRSGIKSFSGHTFLALENQAIPKTQYRIQCNSGEHRTMQIIISVNHVGTGLMQRSLHTVETSAWQAQLGKEMWDMKWCF